MKYQIEIKGMHCTGCSTLIQMSLEDEGLKNAEVDINRNIAIFESNISDVTKVEEILRKVFTGLPDYSYKNIKNIN